MNRSRSRSGQVGSLPLALLVSIIVGGLVVVLVARTINVQRQVHFDETYHGVLPAADAGAEISQFRLNTEMELESAGNDGFTAGFKPAADFEEGERTVTQGPRELDGRTYTWVMTRRDGYWEVDTTSVDPRSRSEVSRRVLVELRDQPIVPLAAFADALFNLGGNSSADSYDSESGDWCTGNGVIASNGVVRFQSTGVARGDCQDFHHPDVSGRTVDGVILFDWEANSGNSTTEALPGGDRCGRGGSGQDGVTEPNHANCRELVGSPHATYPGPQGQLYPRAATELERRNLTSPMGVNFMEQAFALCDEVSEFSATAHDDGTGVARLTPADPATSPAMADIDFTFRKGHFTCHEDAYFNMDTIIEGDSDEPVIMFVRGELIFRKSGGQGGLGSQGRAVFVNCEGTCEPITDRPQAGSLWIFVDGGGPLQIRNNSSIAGVFWAPEAACEGSPSAAQADIFGSLICGTQGDQSSQGGWRFHYDDSLGDETDGLYIPARWEEIPS